MSSRRFVRVMQVLAVSITIAAVTVLLLTGRASLAIGVAVAGALLTGVTSVVERRVVAAREGNLSVADQRQNLFLALKFGHAFTAIGVLAIAAGALLALTDVADDDVAQVLLVWIGPFALVAGVGIYTAHNVWRRELSMSNDS